MAWTCAVGHDPDLCPYGQGKHQEGDGGDEFMRSNSFSRASRPLRRKGDHLDNLTLIPASLLPFKPQWQRIANELPRGGVLIVTPIADLRQGATLRFVRAH